MGMKGEEDVAQQVIAWLEAQRWDVYQEVAPHGGGTSAADIVAVRCGLVWVIECKTSLSLAVMAQASRWTVHLRSIAVPLANRGSDERALAESICRGHLRVGVLYVGANGVQERVPAPLMRHYHAGALRLKAKLEPEHKTHAKAGCQGGDRWTPYQRTMRDIRSFLAQQGSEGASIKQIMEAVGKGHYANGASAKQCIPKALVSFESEWCEVVGEGKSKTYRVRTPETK